MSTRSVLIAPSILSADFTRLGEHIRVVEEAGADMIHVDVMDGHFVPNLTMGPFVVEAVRRATDLPIDAHLMVTDPEQLTDAFIDAGADYVVFHVEATEEPRRLIERIRGRGAKPGLAVNPANPADSLEPHLDDIDLALVMTVNPGYSGQSFMPEVMPKLKRISEVKSERGLDLIISVDGGVGLSTVETVVRNGGEALVAASAIFGAEDPGEALRSLRAAAEAALP
jgi:ribulose-phosphate 3-epimerase